MLDCSRETVVSMNKTDKNAVISPKVNPKVNPAKAKVLPFDDGSKKKIASKNL